MTEFRVIPGGLLFADDITGPDKPPEEWTADETENYYSELWEKAEQGDIFYTVKHLNTSSEVLSIVINTLDTIREKHEAETAALNIRNEWQNTTCEELLEALKRLQRDQANRL